MRRSKEFTVHSSLFFTILLLPLAVTQGINVGPPRFYINLGAQYNLLSLYERPYDNVSIHAEDPGFALPPEFTDGGDPELTAHLETAQLVPQEQPFSTFLEHHRTAASGLIELFKYASNHEELRHLALTVKDYVNEGLFIYALTHTIYNSEDLQGVRIPSLAEIFPSSFFPHEELTKARIDAAKTLRLDEPLVRKYEPEFSGSDLKPENRLGYWREDITLNSHHWHWHLSNPCWINVTNDRKGELFYYMHHQMVARYDMERLSLGLPRVKKLEEWREPIPEGYFSHLTMANSGSAYGSRQDNTFLKNFRRDQNSNDYTDIVDMELWRSRLLDAIHLGYMTDREGNRVILSDDVTHGKRGIEIMGDCFEADKFRSVNAPYYGNLHNIGHNIISVAHDNDNSHKASMAVMAFVETAVRDPVFFRWHKFVDSVFEQYKFTQPPYTDEELSLRDVDIQSVMVDHRDGHDILYTGFNHRIYNVSKGLDFHSMVPVEFDVTYLDHKPFTYHIKVRNHGESRQVTVRIFMAPKYNGQGHTMPYMEQRNLWTEMDKFVTTLTPDDNCIFRSSKESSVTMPLEPTFEDLEHFDYDFGDEDSENVFCKCGWPQNLLLPRGKPEGMTFQLLVMLTDYEKDKVIQNPDARRCSNGMSYCGIKDGLYPDKRPMGFPFDRKLPDDMVTKSATTEQYFSKIKNIALQDVTITYLDDFVDKRNERDDRPDNRGTINPQRNNAESRRYRQRRSCRNH